MNILFLVRFLLGQFGDNALRAQAKAMLLDNSDLEGDWTMLGERSWRTGVVGQFSEIKRRARRAGTFAASRFFRRGASRGVMVQVICYATPGDAETRLPRALTRRVHIKAKWKLHSTADIEIPKGFAESWRFNEIIHTTKLGLASQKIIAGVVSNVLFVVSGGDITESPFGWEDLGSIAKAQAAKIESFVAMSNNE